MQINRAGNIFRKAPVFLVLLPCFFVLHGFTRNYYQVPWDAALLLVAQYLLTTIVVTAICWLFFHDLLKASLFSFLLVTMFFFFGSIEDFLKARFPGSFIYHYKWLLPGLIVVLLMIFILLKRSRGRLSAFYLNLLFSILILIDAGWLTLKIARAKATSFNATTAGFDLCDSCAKPDIYLIIPDQYSGSKSLMKLFNFDNSHFEKALADRGFHIIPNSRSNYNLTPFSVASILDMNYLPDVKPGRQDFGTVSYSYGIMRKSKSISFLKAMGYRFYNYSIFDFDDEPAHRYESFLPYGKKLITSETLTGRMLEDFQPDILKGRFGSRLRNEFAYKNLQFNNTIIDLTKKLATAKHDSPRFVYTHLMLPHFPYYFDRNGSALSVDEITASFAGDTSGYTGYLEYSNARLLDLLDHILHSSAVPPVIILLSDHGLQKSEDFNDDFVNLNAIFLPGKKYDLFNDNLTNVNELRVVFNSCLSQHLPLVHDSVINVRNHKDRAY